VAIAVAGSPRIDVEHDRRDVHSDRVLDRHDL